VAFPNLTYLMLTLTALVAALFFMYYIEFVKPKSGTLEWISRAVTKPRFRFEFTRHPMTRRDIAPLAIILVVFTFISFYKLGDNTAPQTFYRFDNQNPSIEIALSEETQISEVMFYTGLWTGNYELEYSSDGVNWHLQPSLSPEKHPTAMAQSHADLFKWRIADFTPDEVDFTHFSAQYLRISMQNADTSTKPLELGEVVIRNVNGDSIMPLSAPRALFDEQSLAPERPTYMNSMYFDEIYHGRTAYETIRGIYPYETVHPPLGKTIISVGISIFGMTPFGWRCMGTLFGVAMLAALYVLIKNMFGKTSVALCGTLLLGFDFMRYTQTRIATIDTYPVFFIILAYLFMYRFLTTRGDEKLHKNLLPLFLSGLSFGLGVATKWVVIFAGAGLFVLYLMKLITDYKYYYLQDSQRGAYAKRVVQTLALTAVFFLIIPAIIYILSYIPFGTARDMTIRGGMLWDVKYYELIRDVQQNTFRYHATLTATHPYSSVWYEWISNLRPMLYYLDRPAVHMKSTFAAFGNPLIWWAGFAAIIVMVIRCFTHKDVRALFIVIGYFAQLLPWLLITRCVFVYHYFPSVIFLILALAHMFDTCVERGEKRGCRAMVAFTTASGVLFAMFYPVISGMVVPEAYIKGFLKWFKSWPI